LRGQGEKNTPAEKENLKSIWGKWEYHRKKRVRHKFMTHPLVLIIFPMLMKYHSENGLARYE